MWADANELRGKSLWFKFVNLLTNCGHIILITVMTANLIVARVHWVTLVENCCITLGALMVSTKALFFIWKRRDITEMIARINAKNLRLQEKARADPIVRKMRKSYYLQEMLITIPFLFNADFLIVVMILQPFFSKNPSLPCPAVFPFDTTPWETGFWVAYIYQGVNTLLMSTMYALTETTIGNNYSQIVLNFDVLNHELRNLGYAKEEKGEVEGRINHGQGHNNNHFQLSIKRKLIDIVEEFQSLCE